VIQTWVLHCDWLKAKTYDSIWAIESLPRAFPVSMKTDVHCGTDDPRAHKPLLSSPPWEGFKDEGNTKKNTAN
jgi:hypothetical protein